MTEPQEGPTRTWKCDCGNEVQRWRGDGDVQCDRCGAEFNSFGQRLRADWRGNASNWDEDVDDLEGFERQQLAIENRRER